MFGGLFTLILCTPFFLLGVALVTFIAKLTVKVVLFVWG